MAKAILTAEDKNDDGDVKINVKFDPPLSDDDEGPFSAAQALIAKALEFIAEECTE